ncbi:MAG TPA: dTMP kinase [Lacipirellulaceae bacterium]|nr:dTMP kinase [Lacipirellulaceae bacterium]HMP05588.1 dTMP kinase [Lacipirellulaceae bacterium]
MDKLGIFIAVDGIDGAGKTTQVERLRAALERAGEQVISSKEPTNGRWGRKLRESARNGRLSPQDELEAFVADRHDHVESVIGPALADGKIVLVDRYFYSTIAYQGARSGIEPCTLYSQMRELFPVPDLALLVDVLPEVGVHRISHSRGESPNEFERIDALRDTRAAFLKLLDCAPEITLVNGHGDIDHVFHECSHTLVDGALREKRCFKSYECDIFFCSFRETGECTWPSLRAKVLSA